MPLHVQRAKMLVVPSETEWVRGHNYTVAPYTIDAWSGGPFAL